jgi:deoxycytidylate deaminase
MKKLTGTEHDIAVSYFTAATEAAKQSSCQRAQCGAVIVKDSAIIGTGYNSPAGNEPNRCFDTYTLPDNNKHDVTCCVHAEVRAIHDALQKYPSKLNGATLYFMRIKNDEQTFAGVPYCTICSKEALDSNLAAFVLWHQEGIAAYNTQEYNNISYQFYKDEMLWNLK